jgi:hypothetical protein
LAAEVTFERATEAHARELAPMLRPLDLAEVQACGRADALEALLRSVRLSAYTVGIRFDGVLAALFGVVAVDGETLLGLPAIGCLWFLTGTACDTHPIALVRVAKATVPALHRASGFRELRNYLDVRYRGALRLAQAVGFEVLTTVPHGPHGLPFHLVARRAEPWVR